MGNFLDSDGIVKLTALIKDNFARLVHRHKADDIDNIQHLENYGKSGVDVRPGKRQVSVGRPYFENTFDEKNTVTISAETLIATPKASTLSITAGRNHYALTKNEYVYSGITVFILDSERTVRSMVGVNYGTSKQAQSIAGGYVTFQISLMQPVESNEKLMSVIGNMRFEIQSTGNFVLSDQNLRLDQGYSNTDIRYIGDWQYLDSSHIFNPNDVVTYNEVSFICLKKVVKGQLSAPDVSGNTYWTVFARGLRGEPGAPGTPGIPGKTAYQAAKEAGYKLTESEFNRDMSFAYSTAQAAYSNAAHAQDAANTANTAAIKAQQTADGIQVGGRNLVSKAAISSNLQDLGSEYPMWYMYSNKTKLGGLRIEWGKMPMEYGREYILSFSIQKTEGVITSLGGHNEHEIISCKRNGEPVTWNGSYPNDTGIYRYELLFRTRYKEGGTPDIWIQPNRTPEIYNQQYKVKIWDVKLEHGNRATTWTPALEDMWFGSELRLKYDPNGSRNLNDYTTPGIYVFKYGPMANLPEDFDDYNANNIGPDVELKVIYTNYNDTPDISCRHQYLSSSRGKIWKRDLKDSGTWSDWVKSAYDIWDVMKKPTSFTPASHASTGTGFGVGSSTQYGHVKLSSAVEGNTGAVTGAGVASYIQGKGAFFLSNINISFCLGNTCYNPVASGSFAVIRGSSVSICVFYRSSTKPGGTSDVPWSATPCEMAKNVTLVVNSSIEFSSYNVVFYQARANGTEYNVRYAYNISSSNAFNRVFSDGGVRTSIIRIEP